MKTKTLFNVAIIAFATNALLANMAVAVTKCVALGSSTKCTASLEYNKADWSATCTTGSTSTPIQGIAFCSNQEGSTQYVIKSTISTSSTATENRNCWCKMVSPVVSSWVFVVTFASGNDCARMCSDHCASGAQYYSGFRSALFSDLSD